MDIFAHSLWSVALVKALPKPKPTPPDFILAILLGILPDLICFVPLTLLLIYRRIKSGVTWEQALKNQDPTFKRLMDYAQNAYKFTHSLVLWLLAFGLVWLFLGKVPWVFLAWGLHICFDIFSHTDKFFPTPFLFPISKFKISGIAWSNPIFMVINYSSVLGILWFLFRIA